MGALIYLHALALTLFGSPVHYQKQLSLLFAESLDQILIRIRVRPELGHMLANGTGFVESLPQATVVGLIGANPAMGPVGPLPVNLIYLSERVPLTHHIRDN